MDAVTTSRAQGGAKSKTQGFPNIGCSATNWISRAGPWFAASNSRRSRQTQCQAAPRRLSTVPSTLDFLCRGKRHLGGPGHPRYVRSTCPILGCLLQPRLCSAKSGCPLLRVDVSTYRVSTVSTPRLIDSHDSCPFFGLAGSTHYCYDAPSGSYGCAGAERTSPLADTRPPRGYSQHICRKGGDDEATSPCFGRSWQRGGCRICNRGRRYRA